MLLRIHFFPGLVLLALGLGLEFAIAGQLLKRHSRTAVYLGTAAAMTLLLVGYLVEFQRVQSHFGVWWATWTECAALMELLGLMVAGFAIFFFGDTEFRPQRRVLLQAAGAGLCIAPCVAAGFGI